MKHCHAQISKQTCIAWLYFWVKMCTRQHYVNPTRWKFGKRSTNSTMLTWLLWCLKEEKANSNRKFKGKLEYISSVAPAGKTYYGELRRLHPAGGAPEHRSFRKCSQKFNGNFRCKRNSSIFAINFKFLTKIWIFRENLAKILKVRKWAFEPPNLSKFSQPYEKNQCKHVILR